MGKNLIKQSIFGILDQLFSSLLIFGINIYFARKLFINEIGIFALVFASFGFAQVLQQAILERPFLIKKNIFYFKTIVVRFALVIGVLFFTILYFYFSETNSLPNVSLNPLFIIPWIFLGVVQLVFNLMRVYYYAISKENVAFYMSFSSTIIIFIIFLIGQNYLEKRITIFMFLITIVKIFIMLYFTSYFLPIAKEQLTDDSSKKQYLNLILISLSIFLKGRFIVFYLANFAFTLTGIYEILRNILEIVLMPFRPISQTLLNKFSTDRQQNIKIYLNYFVVFSIFGILIGFIFYFSLDLFYNLYNISSISSPKINFYLTGFVVISILLIPINANLLAYKLFFDELVVKLLPVLYLVTAIFISSEVHNMEFFLKVIYYSTLIEIILATFLLIFRKAYLSKKHLINKI